MPLLLQNALAVDPTNPLSTKEKVQIKVTSKEGEPLYPKTCLCQSPQAILSECSWGNLWEGLDLEVANQRGICLYHHPDRAPLRLVRMRDPGKDKLKDVSHSSALPAPRGNGSPVSMISMAVARGRLGSAVRTQLMLRIEDRTTRRSDALYVLPEPNMPWTQRVVWPAWRPVRVARRLW